VIIDCHCHAGETADSLAVYLARAAAAGIDRTVVFSVFHPDYAVANEQVARLVAGAAERLIGFAFVHAGRDRGRIRAMVARAVGALGFRGIKAHRRDAPLTREVCQAARDFGVPLLYDIMGEVAEVEPLVRQFPDVRFIIPHLGSFADAWSAQLAFIELLCRYDNVFTDSAGVRHFDLLEQALARAGAHKLLFGSDGPWLHPGLELHKIHLLGLSPHEERLVTGGNLVRLIAPPDWRAASAAPDRSRPGAAPPSAGCRPRTRAPAGSTSRW
jgi:predicted TIM-barrel fold metal-dependent hydrolase